MNAVLAPRRSRIAFVATVVPWTIPSAWRSRNPRRTASPGLGVDRSFVVTTSRPRKPTKSVNVPPTSTPMSTAGVFRRSDKTLFPHPRRGVDRGETKFRRLRSPRQHFDLLAEFHAGLGRDAEPPSKFDDEATRIAGPSTGAGRARICTCNQLAARSARSRTSTTASQSRLEPTLERGYAPPRWSTGRPSRPRSVSSIATAPLPPTD